MNIGSRNTYPYVFHANLNNSDDTNETIQDSECPKVTVLLTVIRGYVILLLSELT